MRKCSKELFYIFHDLILTIRLEWSLKAFHSWIQLLFFIFFRKCVENNIPKPLECVPFIWHPFVPDSYHRMIILLITGHFMVFRVFLLFIFSCIVSISCFPSLPRVLIWRWLQEKKLQPSLIHIQDLYLWVCLLIP